MGTIKLWRPQSNKQHGQIKCFLFLVQAAWLFTLSVVLRQYMEGWFLWDISKTKAGSRQSLVPSPPTVAPSPPRQSPAFQGPPEGIYNHTSVWGGVVEDSHHDKRPTEAWKAIGLGFLFTGCCWFGLVAFFQPARAVPRPLRPFPGTLHSLLDLIGHMPSFPASLTL